jgi:hypothetical protein
LSVTAATQVLVASQLLNTGEVCPVDASGKQAGPPLSPGAASLEEILSNPGKYGIIDPGGGPPSSLVTELDSVDKLQTDADNTIASQSP